MGSYRGECSNVVSRYYKEVNVKHLFLVFTFAAIVLYAGLAVAGNIEGDFGESCNTVCSAAGGTCNGPDTQANTYPGCPTAKETISTGGVCKHRGGCPWNMPDFKRLCACDGVGGGPPPTWFDTLTSSQQASIIWKSDAERNDFYDWTYNVEICDVDEPDYPNCFLYPGGNSCVDHEEVNTCNDPQSDNTATINSSIVHSGNQSVKTRIINVGIKNPNCDPISHDDCDPSAVRLFRSTDKPWDDCTGGVCGNYLADLYPNGLYFSNWMYFPHEYEEMWWWNIFQFKSRNASGNSTSLHALNVEWNYGGEFMQFYIGCTGCPQSTYLVGPVPVAQWIHVECFYNPGLDPNGSMTWWIDGQQVLQVSGSPTMLPGPGGENSFGWAIGNDTDYIEGPEGWARPPSTTTTRPSAPSGSAPVSNAVNDLPA